jgi:hypothetical protein
VEDVPWEISYADFADGRVPYETFLRGLNAYHRTVVLAAVDGILARQGTTVCSNEWGSALGAGLYEFRIRRSLSTICNEAGIVVPSGFAADDEVLIRVFFTTHGRRILLLLGGYDKGADPSPKRQQRAIAAARKVLLEYKRDVAAQARRSKGR